MKLFDRVRDVFSAFRSRVRLRAYRSQGGIGLIEEQAGSGAGTESCAWRFRRRMAAKARDDR